MSNDSSSNELYDKTPFRSPLIESGYEGSAVDIKALKCNPEKIVRVSSHIAYPQDLQPWLFRHKKVIDKLHNEYGFNIANMDIVIGPSEDKDGFPRVYIITDRIYGSVLRDKTFHPSEIPAAKDILDSFFSSMVQYYWDVARLGGDYNYDLAQNNQQFIWGRRKGESEDRIWLVDLGVQIAHHNVDFVSNSYLLSHVYDEDHHGLERFGVWKDIKFLEQKHGIRLDEARQKLIQFMEDLLSQKALTGLDISRAVNLKYLAGIQV